MQLILQHGILANLSEAGILETRKPFWSEAAPVETFLAMHGLMPICVLDNAENPYSDDGFKVIPPVSGLSGVGQFEELETHLIAHAMGTGRLDSSVLFLVQQLRAARYHLTELAMRHVDAVAATSGSAQKLQDYLATTPNVANSVEDVVEQFPGLAWTRGLGHRRFLFPVCKIGPLDRLHFELSAALVTMKRALDAIPASMNSSAWAKGAGYSNSMNKTVGRLRKPVDNTPSHIRDRLLSDWDEWGAQLRDYRTCAEHFSTLAPTGIACLSYVVSEQGMLGLICPLPDNPSANSARKFTWKGGVEALSYVLLTYQRTLRLAEFVIENATPEPAVVSHGYAAQFFSS